jgi:hypothetical protein
MAALCRFSHTGPSISWRLRRSLEINTPAMPRFKLGDRVQLAGDIARFYTCVIGVVVDGQHDQTSVLVHYRVRLADQTVGTFFDFQLQSPPIVRASVVYDGPEPRVPPVLNDKKTRHPVEARRISLVGGELAIHLKITGNSKKAITGKVNAANNPVTAALVTILVQDRPVQTTPTNNRGEFDIHDLSGGDVIFEIFVSGRRVTAYFKI